MITFGLGPVAIAFYAWDETIRRGNIQLLGTPSSAAPLLSTLWLVLSGPAPAAGDLTLAALLIAAGAVMAASARGGAETRDR